MFAVYVVDSGIDTAVTDVSRATSGWSAFSGTVDCYGHGTAVASVLGGTTLGVAKGCNLIAVRVLDCAGAGSTSSVISALNWVKSTADANAGVRRSVVNLSIAGGFSGAMNAAVASLTASNHVVVSAAGNAGADACASSPASAASSITVAATDYNDVKASFSNAGTCVDLYAPGSSITVSDLTSGPSGTKLEASTTPRHRAVARSLHLLFLSLCAWWVCACAQDGTSFAAPHVAGVAARFLNKYPNATVADVTASLACAATAGIVSGSPTSTPNLLLYSPAGNLAYTPNGGACADNSCPLYVVPPPSLPCSCWCLALMTMCCPGVGGLAVGHRSGCGTAAQGTCMDGWCRCACFRYGSQCQTQLTHTVLPLSLSGSTTGSTSGAPSHFGQVRARGAQTASAPLS